MQAIDDPSSRTNAFATAPSYDEPFRFGRQPTVRVPFPFSERQFAPLLIARSRIQSEDSAEDKRAD